MLSAITSLKSDVQYPSFPYVFAHRKWAILLTLDRDRRTRLVAEALEKPFPAAHLGVEMFLWTCYDGDAPPGPSKRRSAGDLVSGPLTCRLSTGWNTDN